MAKARLPRPLTPVFFSPESAVALRVGQDLLGQTVRGFVGRQILLAGDLEDLFQAVVDLSLIHI